jgi:hypothetical protein
MPSRKQRRRVQKERRHQYETVWVDAEGNELEEPPEDTPPSPRERRPDAKKSNSQSQQKRRPNERVPQPPAWRRAIRRGALLGLVITVFFYIANGKASPGTRVAIAVVWGIGYTALFIPFTYGLDRYAYRRYERRQGERATKR